MSPLKKMILVSSELLSSLQNKPKNNLISKLEKKMKNILRKKTINYQTLAQFRKYQDSYLKLVRKQKEPIRIPIIDEPKSTQHPKFKTKYKARHIKKKKLVSKPKLGPEFIDDGSVFEYSGSDHESTSKSVELESSVDDFTSNAFGELAGKYISPYINRRHTIDNVYGIRKDDEDFKIGDSNVTVKNNDIYVDSVPYQGTSGLWELLTKKSVDRTKVTPNDLEQYKKILIQSNAHKNRFGRIKSSKGKKYKTIISNLFPAKWTKVD